MQTGRQFVIFSGTDHSFTELHTGSELSSGDLLTTNLPIGGPGKCSWTLPARSLADNKNKNKLTSTTTTTTIYHIKIYIHSFSLIVPFSNILEFELIESNFDY